MAGSEVEATHAGTTGISLSAAGNTISVRNRLSYSYDVRFAAEDVLSPDNPALHDAIGGRRCLIVMGNRVGALYGTRLLNYLRQWSDNKKFDILTLPVSENTKNMDTVMRICAEGKRLNLSRKSLFVAMGGGVLMDCVGLASSIYMRKLDYVRIPTTLVGQVDAGIGLKTGVDFEGRKNLIGTFHPPVCVLNDSRFLRTLGADEIRNGLAEIAKMAIVSDAKLFSMLKDNSRRIVDCYASGSDESLTRRINVRAVMRMLEQLQANPYETNLERLVDFGHTFSPFLEMHTRHRIRHGQAVAMDMAISAEISCLIGRTDAEYRDSILSMLADFGLSLHDAEAFDAYRMWQSLDSIVLRRGGRLNLVIPAGPGRAEFLHEGEELDVRTLRQALENIAVFQTRWGFR